jgi:hypothetical protein
MRPSGTRENKQTNKQTNKMTSPKQSPQTIFKFRPSNSLD